MELASHVPGGQPSAGSSQRRSPGTAQAKAVRAVARRGVRMDGTP